MNKGKFIAIDGGDGSGKATQTKLLIDDLEKKEIKIEQFSFPQYDTFFGDLVSKYLQGEFGKLEDVPVETASLLYELDRFQSAPEMFDKLDSGIWIASDRWATANLGYQPAKFEDENERWKFYDWLKDVQKRLPKPDRILFLDVDVITAEKLLDARENGKHGDGKLDIHEANTKYKLRVQEMLKAVATREDWTRINCVEEGKIKSVNEIHALIMDAIDDLLPDSLNS